MQMFRTCILGTAKAKTNEEYKKIAKKRIALLVFIMLLGAAAAAASLIFGGDSYSAGFICGTGVGLLFAGAIFIVRILKVLKSEDKIKEERLKATDERNEAIGLAAARTTMVVFLICCYIAIVVSSFISQPVSMALAAVFVGFALIYVICTQVYNKLM